MKKILAILLALAMVLPMCVAVNAADTNVERKPFVLSNSDDLGIDDKNFYPKVTFWSTASYVTEDSIKVAAPMCGGGKNAIEIAENLKDHFEDFPEGTRYIRDLSMRVAMETLAEDVIFMEKGVEVAKKWFTEFLEHYSEIGGQLDGIAADVEIVGGSCYYLTQTAKSNPYIFKQIVSNPMYEEKIRPQLVERGFKFWPDVTDETPEIYGICETSGSEYALSRSIWNVVIRNYLNQMVNDIALEAMTKYFPNARLFDYQARTTYGWHKNMSDKGVVSTGGNYETAGHVNYMNTYANRPGSGFYEESGVRLYKNIPSYNGILLEQTPFNQVLWDMVHAKNYKESAPDGRFTVILCWHNYTRKETSYCNSPYFTEMTYHMGMMDPDPFQCYCMESEILSRDSDPELVVQILSEQIDELNRVAGYADRKHISVPYTWNDKYILTGMYAGGRNIWRITPDTSTGITLEQFKVAGTTDPTFSIGGKTVTFPGGKIIEDAKITEVGSCGYWVETAKDVLPVITCSETRYSEYPALLETYESYEAGANYEISSASPAGCWEVKKSKDTTAKIVDVSGNQALALTGTYSLKLKNILKNITAGDTYAENQAWEVEVTVPAGMSAEAEIVLFDIYGSKAKSLEGGLKIAGGKVYYDNAGQYVEMTGVDVSAGGKFKVQRCVDFNNAESFICDYTIYDASGKVLGQVKDVPMIALELPVQKIGLGVSGITGDAVLLDNLKLYANGLAADLELYNAKTGMQHTDVDTAKSEATAYRLSWMNATSYEKVYSIVAAYYNGDTLVEEKVVKEIKMAPGADHVDTGIVEVAEGQSVKLYARNDSKAEPEGGDNAGNTDNEKPGSSAGGEDTVMLIAIIAGGVVLLAIIVVAIVVLTKKKPVPAEENKTEE